MIESTTENAPHRESSQTSEFDALRWSVITSDDCAASSLSYAEAVRTIERMSTDSFGLCIVTDEAAKKLHPAKSGETAKNIYQPEDLSQKSLQEIL